MNLREQFEKEKNDDCREYMVSGGGWKGWVFTDEYVEWLEKENKQLKEKVKELQKKLKIAESFTI